MKYLRSVKDGWTEVRACRVRPQVRSCGICGGHSGTGAGFLRVLSVSPANSNSSSSTLINDSVIRSYVVTILSASLNNQLKNEEQKLVFFSFWKKL
jgi:hypothetical protein